MSSSDHGPVDPAGGPGPRPVHALGDPYGTSSLTGRERAAWATFTAVSLSFGAQLEAGLHREAGLTPFEFHLLFMLGAGDAAEGDGEMSMSRAAHLVDASLSRLSHVVRRLEERGWLERRPSPDDARVTLVRLTPEGHRRHATGLPVYESIVHRLLAGRLSEAELAELTRLCLRLLSDHKADHWVTSALGGEEAGAGRGARSAS